MIPRSRFFVAALSIAAAALPARAQEDALADDAVAVVAGAPVRIAAVAGHSDLICDAPQPTPEELAVREACIEQLWQQRAARFQLPIDPNAFANPIMGPPTEPAALARGTAFQIFRNTLMTDTFTNNSTSSTNEPSCGMQGRMTLYTGNKYASVSGDYGQTFGFVDPATAFPNPPSGSFCCDQVVYYERTRALMCWYLQYNGNNNVCRLVVYRSQSDLANNNWLIYDITPSALGYATSVIFDFPDLSASSNNLYITTNILGAADAAIIIRLDLDDLRAGSVVAENFRTSLPNLRCTHGATSTMYVGTQVDNNTLQIHSWPESSGSPTSVNRDVDTWFTAISNAPSPDGTNWVRRDFHDILASAVGNSRILFMWGSAEGGGFSWPNVRWARFNTSGVTFVDQSQIWHPDTAWAYPAVHANDRGDFGGMISAGGGSGGSPTPYPTLFTWLADYVNSYTISPLENNLVAAGTNGPTSNRWGDYYTSRRSSQYGNTWVGSGFVLTGGGGNADAEPRYVWFGRTSDAPPATNTISVDLVNTLAWEEGNSAHPYNTVNEGYYATVSNDTLEIGNGSYLETITMNRPLRVSSVGGAARIGGP